MTFMNGGSLNNAGNVSHTSGQVNAMAAERAQQARADHDAKRARRANPGVLRRLVARLRRRTV